MKKFAKQFEELNFMKKKDYNKKSKNNKKTIKLPVYTMEEIAYRVKNNIPLAKKEDINHD